MSPGDRFQLIVAKRITHLARIRDIAAEGFERADDPHICVRRLDVVNYVAERLGRIPGPRLFIDVQTAVALLGWQCASVGNRRYFRQVKAKGVSADVALKATRDDKRRARHGPQKL